MSTVGIDGQAGSRRAMNSVENKTRGAEYAQTLNHFTEQGKQIVDV